MDILLLEHLNIEDKTEEESYKEHFIEKLEAVTSSSHPPLWDELLTVLEKLNSS